MLDVPASFASPRWRLMQGSSWTLSTSAFKLLHKVTTYQWYHFLQIFRVCFWVLMNCFVLDLHRSRQHIFHHFTYLSNGTSVPPIAHNETWKLVFKNILFLDYYHRLVKYVLHLYHLVSQLQALWSNDEISPHWPYQFSHTGKITFTGCSKKVLPMIKSVKDVLCSTW